MSWFRYVMLTNAMLAGAMLLKPLLLIWHPGVHPMGHVYMYMVLVGVYMLHGFGRYTISGKRTIDGRFADPSKRYMFAGMLCGKSAQRLAAIIVLLTIACTCANMAFRRVLHAERDCPDSDDREWKFLRLLSMSLLAAPGRTRA